MYLASGENFVLKMCCVFRRNSYSYNWKAKIQKLKETLDELFGNLIYFYFFTIKTHVYRLIAEKIEHCIYKATLTVPSRNILVLFH